MATTCAIEVPIPCRCGLKVMAREIYLPRIGVHVILYIWLHIVLIGNRGRRHKFRLGSNLGIIYCRNLNVLCLLSRSTQRNKHTQKSEKRQL